LSRRIERFDMDWVSGASQVINACVWLEENEGSTLHGLRLLYQSGEKGDDELHHECIGPEVHVAACTYFAIATFAFLLLGKRLRLGRLLGLLRWRLLLLRLLLL